MTVGIKAACSWRAAVPSLLSPPPHNSHLPRRHSARKRQLTRLNGHQDGHTRPGRRLTQLLDRKIASFLLITVIKGPVPKHCSQNLGLGLCEWLPARLGLTQSYRFHPCPHLALHSLSPQGGSQTPMSMSGSYGDPFYFFNLVSPLEHMLYNPNGFLIYVIRKQTDREKECFQLLVHTTDAYNIWGWTRL